MVCETRRVCTQRCRLSLIIIWIISRKERSNQIYFFLRMFKFKTGECVLVMNGKHNKPFTAVCQVNSTQTFLFHLVTLPFKKIILESVPLRRYRICLRVLMLKKDNWSVEWALISPGSHSYRSQILLYCTAGRPILQLINLC
jgi:hypothetical protein